MKQDLTRHSIAMLEEVFAASNSDWETLNDLEAELRYRSAPQAYTLLVAVQGALCAAKAAVGAMAGSPAKHALAAARPSDIRGRKGDSLPQVVYSAVPVQTATPARSLGRSTLTLVVSPVGPRGVPPVEPMTLDDADKVRKAAPAPALMREAI